jgi:hypothetical protein
VLYDQLMQATVRGFDHADGSGSVFFDDGSVAEFGPEVFAASGLRLLRRGQRVTVQRGRSGAVTALTLATLPLPPAASRVSTRRPAGPGAPQ